MNQFTLPNGLRVFLLPADTPFTAVVLAYTVGAAHEEAPAIGVAHLLEHLLFEDERIAYDRRLQEVGGSTNAYTGQDYTVYYARVPQEAASLALELEAARLFDLEITEEKLAIQRQVVAEEFRQRYLNPPYADRFFSVLRGIFPAHPYQHMVIGETPDQILSLSLETVQNFYSAYYTPRNAILCVSGGGISSDLVQHIEKLYNREKGGVPLPVVPSAEDLPSPEPLLTREGAVPQVLVTWAFRLPPIDDPYMPAVDLLDDYLGDERSGYLVRHLVHEEGLASRLSTYVWQFHFGGLWVIEAYLSEGISVNRYEDRLSAVLHTLPSERLMEALDVYRPQRYLSLHRQREKALGRALALVHSVLAGHLEWFTEPLHPYETLTEDSLRLAVEKYMVPGRRLKLHYIPRRAGAMG
ncbi:MAG: insulinase family protein [Bacteroidia bacterium]|nr:insulinase family protein [Bacteroidia bacterium]